MLMVKLLGGILIVVSTSIIGILKAKEYENRTLEIRDLICLLQMLETEICYMSNILCDALYNCGKTNMQRNVTNIFIEAAELLKSLKMTSFDAWNNAINNNINKTSLNEEDTEILRNLGNSLGTSDNDGQIKNIRFVLKQLEVQLSKAEADRIKYQSMYRKLGILGGIALAVMLF